MNRISEVFEHIACLIYPNRCIFCGRIMPPLENVCQNCTDSLPWIKGEACTECGREKAYCACGRRHENFYDAIISPFYYADRVRDCIHRFKFDSDKRAHRELARIMEDTFHEKYSGIKFDFIAYVPMERRRRFKRGYNQSQLLAERLSENLGIPLGWNMIVKLCHTKVQHECTMRERKTNLIGAFDINPDFDINGKTVLLVDDIKTTGATLNECSKMLRIRGAERVFCLTVATVNSKID